MAGDLSRAHARELIEAGHVMVAGRLEPPRYRVRAGEPIEATLLARHLLRAEGRAPLPPLRILHEDGQVLVLDKPPGQASHPGGADLWGTVSQAAEAHCGPRLPAASGEDRAGIVHRLDKDTSGVMVLAKTETALASLQEQFRRREVHKEYRAIVFGVPRFLSDWIEQPIERDPRHPERMRLAREGGRDAATYYEVLQAFDGYAYLACRPRTGRTHQIRLHLSAIGHPLVGEGTYRPRRAQGLALPGEAPDPGRQCLHAVSLSFRHPASGTTVKYRAPLPDDMAALLDWLRRVRPSR